MTRDDEFAALRVSFGRGDWRALIYAVDRLAEDEILPHWLETELIACIEAKHYGDTEQRRDRESFNDCRRAARVRDLRAQGVSYKNALWQVAEEEHVGTEAIRASCRKHGKKPK
jgi:hypothetical protein